MAVPASDQNGLIELTRTQCLTLLSQVALGRLGVTVGALPAILPVYFRLVDERVIIRVGWDDKLRAAVDRQVVCFQADGTGVSAVGVEGIQGGEGRGWSVLVTGRATVVDDLDLDLDLDPDLDFEGDRDLGRELQAVPLRTWASAGGAGRDRYMRLRSEIISGSVQPVQPSP